MSQQFQLPQTMPPQGQRLFACLKTCENILWKFNLSSLGSRIILAFPVQCHLFSKTKLESQQNLLEDSQSMDYSVWYFKITTYKVFSSLMLSNSVLFPEFSASMINTIEWYLIRDVIRLSKSRKWKRAGRLVP